MYAQAAKFGQQQNQPQNFNTGPKPWDPVAPPPAAGLEVAWQVGLCSTCVEYPGTCLYTCFCTCCSAYNQRQLLLGNDWNNYVCCKGICFAEKVCGCAKDCPQLCMVLETICCITCAVKANRMYVQEKYWIKDSLIETCFLMCCGGGGSATVDLPCNPAKLISLLPCCPDLTPCCGDSGNCQIQLPCNPVAACFLTQQEIEIKARAYPDDYIYRYGKPATVADAPPQQGMPIGMPMMGGGAGAPQQQGYGQPQQQGNGQPQQGPY